MKYFKKIFVLVLIFQPYLNLAFEKLPSRTYQLCLPIRGVQPYHPQHEKQVLAIAQANLTSLVSWALPEKSSEHLNSQIVRALQWESVTKKVYVLDGHAVGFIHYSIFDPWHRLITRYPFGPNATIHHLAIDLAHRKKGYASALLAAAIADCKTESVNRISLWTITSHLENFYRKNGFEAGRNSKLSEYNYYLRLKPHPAKVLLSVALQVGKKKLENLGSSL